MESTKVSDETRGLPNLTNILTFLVLLAISTLRVMDRFIMERRVQPVSPSCYIRLHDRSDGAAVAE